MILLFDETSAPTDLLNKQIPSSTDSNLLSQRDGRIRILKRISNGPEEWNVGRYGKLYNVEIVWN